MRRAKSLIALSLVTALLSGCDGPSSCLREEGAFSEYSPPTFYRTPPPRVPPDLAEPLVLECFAEPFTDVAPYYLGRETIRCRSSRWSVEYLLETGSGGSEGVLLPGLATLTVRPPRGDEERALGRPGLTRAAEFLTDGPSLGVLGVLLAGCELRGEDEFRLPARDLRQGVDYDLALVVGAWSDVGTAWGERRCLEIGVLPQDYTFHLAEDGWPWAVYWPGGYAERAVYEIGGRRPVEYEEPAPLDVEVEGTPEEEPLEPVSEPEPEGEA